MKKEKNVPARVFEVIEKKSVKKKRMTVKTQVKCGTNWDDAPTS